MSYFSRWFLFIFFCLEIPVYAHEEAACTDETFRFHGIDTRKRTDPILYLSIERNCEEGPESRNDLYAYHSETNELDVLQLGSYSQHRQFTSLIQAIEKITKNKSMPDPILEADWPKHSLSFLCDKKKGTDHDEFSVTLSCRLQRTDETGLKAEDVQEIFPVEISQKGAPRYERSIRFIQEGNTYLGIIVSRMMDHASVRVVDLFFLGSQQKRKINVLKRAAFLKKNNLL